MQRRQRFSFFLLVLIVPLLVSCVGVEANIEINANGSGIINLKYRVSRMVESMGKLDGNEKYLPLPVGRVDFERTVARINGLSLNSFSSKLEEKDLVINASLAFSDPSVLSAFLDASGRTAKYQSQSGTSSLSLLLAEGGGPLDVDLERLVNTVFEGYSIDITIKTPSLPSSNAVGTVAAANRIAAFKMPVADLLSSQKPINWDLTWKE
ncbi:hypothetical protein MASR2M78_32640 [Treponema sp.]